MRRWGRFAVFASVSSSRVYRSARSSLRPDRYLVASTGPPGDATTLVERTVDFLWQFRDVCNDPKRLPEGRTFADILDNRVPGGNAGSRWRELEGRAPTAVDRYALVLRRLLCERTSACAISCRLADPAQQPEERIASLMDRPIAGVAVWAMAEAVKAAITERVAFAVAAVADSFATNVLARAGPSNARSA